MEDFCVPPFCSSLSVPLPFLCFSTLHPSHLNSLTGLFFTTLWPGGACLCLHQVYIFTPALCTGLVAGCSNVQSSSSFLEVLWFKRPPYMHRTSLWCMCCEVQWGPCQSLCLQHRRSHLLKYQIFWNTEKTVLESIYQQNWVEELIKRDGKFHMSVCWNLIFS